MKFTYRFFTVVWYVLGFISIIMLFMSVSKSSSVKKIISNGSYTTGVFAKSEDNNITFTVDGEVYTVEPTAFFNGEKGESVTVYYDADDPSSACYEGEKKELLWEVVTMGIISFLLMLFANIYRYKANNL